MAYTPFAVLASILILSFATSQVDTQFENSQDHRIAHTTEVTASQTQGKYALVSLEKLANISTNENIANSKQALESLLKNGKYGGTKRQNISIQNHENRIKTLSGKIDSFTVTSLNTAVHNFSLSTNTTVQMVAGNRNFTISPQDTIKAKNITDPLLIDVGYSRVINKCKHSSIAEKFSKSSQNSGTARGDPLNASNMSSTTDYQQIVYSNDITSYNNNTVDDFAGYISNTTPVNPGNYNDNYATNVTIPRFKPGQKVIIHQGAWKSNINRTIDRECYMSTDNINTPSIFERIEEKSTGDQTQGVYTLVGIDGDTTTSDVGYERIAGASDLVELEGISTGAGENITSFRLNRSLAESENMNPLIN